MSSVDDILYSTSISCDCKKLPQTKRSFSLSLPPSPSPPVLKCNLQQVKLLTIEDSTLAPINKKLLSDFWFHILKWGFLHIDHHHSPPPSCTNGGGGGGHWAVSYSEMRFCTLTTHPPPIVYRWGGWWWWWSLSSFLFWNEILLIDHPPPKCNLQQVKLLTIEDSTLAPINKQLLSDFWFHILKWGFLHIDHHPSPPPHSVPTTSCIQLCWCSFISTTF